MLSDNLDNFFMLSDNLDNSLIIKLVKSDNNSNK